MTKQLLARRARHDGPLASATGPSRGHGDGSDVSGEISGVVTEILPSAMYRVRLGEGPVVTAHIADRVERNFVRVIVGDRVRLELSPLDTGRGRIVEKL